MGYQNLETVASGKVMVAPTFINVSGSVRTLADLKVTGYDPAEEVDEDEWEGGCTGGLFFLSFLSSSGSDNGTYYWIDNGELAAGWYASGSGKAIPGGAESIEIPVGQALWTRGGGYKLVSAGAVSEEDIAFATASVGKVATGNGTPVDLNLGKLYVTGYKPAEEVDEDEWEGGCTGGQFFLSFLKEDGSDNGTYYWIDNGELAAGWYASGSGDAIKGGATSITVPAGQGLWTRGGGYTLHVPGPEL